LSPREASASLSSGTEVPRGLKSALQNRRGTENQAIFIKLARPTHCQPN
jgi:hypothetical protein